MEGTTDIFANLDTSLLELFQRGQIYERLHNLPPHEQTRQVHQILIDHLHNLSPHEQARQLEELCVALRGRTVKYVYFIWVWKFIPLLVINFRQIWQHLTISNILDVLFDTISKVIMFSLRVIRFTVFIVTLFIYFHKVLRIFFVFSDVMTFSNHFMGDAFTFIFQDAKNMLLQHEIIMNNEGNVLYFLKNSDEMSNLKVFYYALYNVLSSTLVTKCNKTDTGISCELVTDSLIFKLSQVITKYYPSLNSNTGTTFLKIITLMLYMTYAILGDILCINIWFFYMYNFIGRVIRYKQIMINLRNIIWKSLFSYLV